ncbi:MAG: rhomboid family intramembrane serine protease [Gemmatimonadales bacterium]
MTPWVRRLVIANAVMFVITISTPEAKALLALVPALVLTRPWTPITYMFLHAGFGHIFFNMLALFFFGSRVESRLGSRGFLQLYFISGLTGALLSVLLNPNAFVVGASGAVFGVQLAYARFWPRDTILIYGVIPVEARWLVVLMTGLSLFGGFGLVEPGIAHFAHLGGYLGGFLYLRWLERRSPAGRFRAQATSVGVPSGGGGRAGLERWSRIRREALHEVNRGELDRILEKITAGGVASLTSGDREFLDRFSGVDRGESS